MGYVTPPAESPNAPSLNLNRSASATVLTWQTNAPGFVLESSTSLAAPVSWTGVVGPIYTIGDSLHRHERDPKRDDVYRLRGPQ